MRERGKTHRTSVPASGSRATDPTATGDLVPDRRRRGDGHRRVPGTRFDRGHRFARRSRSSRTSRPRLRGPARRSSRCRACSRWSSRRSFSRVARGRGRGGPDAAPLGDARPPDGARGPPLFPLLDAAILPATVLHPPQLLAAALHGLPLLALPPLPLLQRLAPRVPSFGRASPRSRTVSPRSLRVSSLRRIFVAPPDAPGSRASEVLEFGRGPALDGLAPRAELVGAVHLEPRPQRRPSVHRGPPLLPLPVARRRAGADHVEVADAALSQRAVGSAPTRRRCGSRRPSRCRRRGRTSRGRNGSRRRRSADIRRDARCRSRCRRSRPRPRPPRNHPAHDPVHGDVGIPHDHAGIFAPRHPRTRRGARRRRRTPGRSRNGVGEAIATTYSIPVRPSATRS